MKAIIIVAHPDDETIWAGGFVLDHPDWEWTVLSLCRAEDADRCPKFYTVCEKLGAQGIICDLDDSPEPADIDPEKDIAERVLKALGKTKWDLCITHGANGEYGHPRHKQVNQEVVRLVKSGRLDCRELWTFAYECDVSEKACKPAGWSNKLVHLSEQGLAEKKRIMQKEYGFRGDSLESALCISPESFFLMGGSYPGEEL